MAQQSQIPQTNPVIAKLEKRQGNASVVRILGYLGSSEDDSLRVHSRLDTSSYVEIARDNIIEITGPHDHKDGRVCIFVDADAQIKVST